MSISLNGNTRDDYTTTEELSINFIGKELFYSNQTLRSVQTEFGVTAFRHDSLEALVAQSGQGARVVVVDQLLTDDLLARPEEYSQAASAGCLAFAFRKESAARYMFDSWNRAQFGDIGYLPMNVTPDVWRSILRLLMHEELFLPCFLAPSFSARIETPEVQRTVPPDKTRRSAEKLPLYSTLTRREKQVLRLVSQGKSNKVIASKLGITEHTVKLHMHNVSGKLGVSNRTAAAHFYFEVAPGEARGVHIE